MCILVGRYDYPTIANGRFTAAFVVEQLVVDINRFRR
jgi:hypothetical protein